jgi:hypothetical protein
LYLFLVLFHWPERLLNDIYGGLNRPLVLGLMENDLLLKIMSILLKELLFPFLGFLKSCFILLDRLQHILRRLLTFSSLTQGFAWLPSQLSY